MQPQSKLLSSCAGPRMCRTWPADDQRLLGEAMELTVPRRREHRCSAGWRQADSG